MSVATYEGAAPVEAQRRRKSVTRFRVAALVYGIGWGFYIPTVGQLYVAEIYAVLGLFFFDWRSILRRHQALRMILLGYGILLAAQIVSDVVNDSQPENYLRGWASIVFAVTSLVFLVAVFERTPKALVWFLVGYSISRMLAQEIDVEGIEADSNYFKARIVPVLYPLALAMSYSVARTSVRSAAVFILAVGFFFFVMEARSKGLIFMTGGALLYLAQEDRRLSTTKIVAMGLPVLALGYAGFRYYVAQTLAGDEITNSAFQLRLAANPYNPFELLYYGRSEVFVALEAIGARPLFGYGSWAPDESGIFSVMWSRIKGYQGVIYAPYIRAHSVLATAWLWAGIFGLVGIMIVFATAVSRFRSILAMRHPLKPVIVVLLIDFVWNAFFSPFGHIRATFPPVLAIAVVAMTSLQARQERGRRSRSASLETPAVAKPLADRA